MDNKAIKHISLIFTFALLLPILGAEALNSFMPEKFFDLAMHSLLESIGGFIALSMSAFLYYRSLHDRELYRQYVWIILALSSMGIFDLFHAVLQPGNNFVWFHSIAVFVGGLFFSMIWLSQIRSLHIPRFIIAFLILMTLTIAAYSLSFSQSIPLMLNEDGGFTSIANTLNLGGGLLFIIATIFFIKEYKKENSEQELLFVGHTLLFGIAGLLFNSSVLFDTGWWFWHVLRLTAYMFAQSFIVLLFLNEVKAHIKIRNELKKSNLNLQDKIASALIKQQAKQIIDANLSKMVSLSAMISLITNQFKTPIQNMRSSLTHIKNKDTQLVSTIENEIKGIENIIEDFLKLHHIPKENERQSLREALEAAIDIISPLLAKTGIDVQTNYQCLSRSKNHDQSLTHAFIYIFQYLLQKSLNPEIGQTKISILVSERINNIQEIVFHENFSLSTDDKLYSEAIDNKNPLNLAKDIVNNSNNSSMKYYSTIAGSKVVIKLETLE